MDRLKLGMWSLFVAGVVLPFFYLVSTESLPAKLEMPDFAIQKEHIWKQA
jgi:hypothetical protein